MPGDGIDGYAREAVTMPAHAFTGQPKGLSHSEAATLTCAVISALASTRLAVMPHADAHAVPVLLAVIAAT